MSDERQASCGGQTLYIVIGLIFALVAPWEAECSTFVKVLTTILSLIGFIPLGKIGYKIGSAITALFCPDAVISDSAIKGSFYLLAWRVLPKLICCVLLICIPAAIMITLFEPDEYSYSQESNTTYQATNNVAEGQTFLEMLEDDINNNKLTPLVYTNNVFLTKDSKWVFYLYIANSKHNQATVYKETKQLDLSSESNISSSSKVLLNEKKYIIWQKSSSEFYVKTPKGNIFSVSTKVRNTAKAGKA